MMRLPPGIRRALRLPVSAERIGRELDDEVRFHVEMRAAELRARGMPPEDAYQEALRRFGDASDLRQYVNTIEVFDMRRTHAREWMEGLLQDVRFGARQFARSRGFFAIAAVTLALGIGSTAAIFSVVRGVLLRPLPYPDADRIVQLWEVNKKGNETHVSDPNFADLRSQTRSFAFVAEMSSPSIVSVSGTDEPVRSRAAAVSSDFFSVLDVRPIRGRLFDPSELQENGAPATMISEGFWRRMLGGADSAIGHKLVFDGKPFTVVGILPASVDFPVGAELWVPRELEAPLPSRTAHNWEVVARLKPGVSIDQARRDASAVARRLKQELGDETGMEGASVVPVRDQMVGGTKTTLLVLLAGSFLLLLIACANVVNLLIARMAARQSEVALRIALGAGRARIARQLLTESLVLALAGGVLGIALANVGVKLLLALEPGNLPRVGDVRLDAQVLAFALGLSLLAAVVMGLLTAWRSGRGDLRDALSQSQRTQGGSVGSERVRRGLVVAQVAMAVVLLVATGLFMRSFERLLEVNPGFRVGNQVIVDVAMADEHERVRVYDALLTRFRAIPGVREAGAANVMPLSGGSAGDGTFLIMNSVNDVASISPRDFEMLMRNPARTGNAEFRVASPGYFSAMAIPLVRGRLFEERDDINAPHVAVISASLAAKRWPNEDPIGKVIEFGNMDGDLRPFTIVGIVGDVHEQELASDPRPTFYASYRQRPNSAWAMNFVLATDRDPAPVMSEVRRVVHDVSPDLPPRIRGINAIVSSSVADRRFVLMLVSVFGGAALLLAALGVYSVISYLVAQRGRELSIRVALGAKGSDILRLVLRQGVVLGALGIGTGVVLALTMTRLIQNMLYGITATDPAAFGGVVAVLLIAALLASWIPARRAARVSPNETLREG